MEHIEKDNFETHYAIIYSIRSNSCDKFYIGSTFNKFNTRLDFHKSCFELHEKHGIGNYMMSYELVKFDDVYIELLEELQVANIKELNERYEEWIQSNINDIFNKSIVAKTKKEYYTANKEILNAPNECVCGGRFVNQAKSTHLKSKKHIKFLTNI